MWHVTRDTWHVTRDMFGGVSILSKFQVPSSYRLWFMILWRSGGKGWIDQSINHKAVYRTAPATPGLLNTRKTLRKLNYFLSGLKFYSIWVSPKIKFYFISTSPTTIFYALLMSPPTKFYSISVYPTTALVAQAWLGGCMHWAVVGNT